MMRWCRWCGVGIHRLTMINGAFWRWRHGLIHSIGGFDEFDASTTIRASSTVNPAASSIIKSNTIQPQPLPHSKPAPKTPSDADTNQPRPHSHSKPPPKTPSDINLNGKLNTIQPLPHSHSKPPPKTPSDADLLLNHNVAQ